MSKSPPVQEGVTHPLDVARHAAMMGAGSAIPGLFIGATYGTLRTQTPVLFSIVSGAQWFAIGATFFGIRTSILNSTGLHNWWSLSRGDPLHPLPEHGISSSDRVRASTISGAATGFSLGFLFRGPRNVIPGTIMFSLFGFTGQHAYDWLDASRSKSIMERREMQEKGEKKQTMLQKASKSSWIPMREVTDEEYVSIMKEKILRTEVEIALIRDKIDALKEEKRLEEVKHMTAQVEPGKKE